MRSETEQLKSEGDIEDKKPIVNYMDKKYIKYVTIQEAIDGPTKADEPEDYDEYNKEQV